MASQFTRSELYDFVWARPMRDLARDFSMSDVALRKRCIRADIPVPPVGYWARLRSGKNVMQPPLPPRSAGMSDLIIFRGDRYGLRRLTDEELLGPVPGPPVFEEPLENVRERYRVSIGRVPVPQDLTSAHELIRNILAEEEARQEGQKGRAWQSWYDAPRFDSPFEQRRLRILNGLLLGCAVRGVKAKVQGRKAREILISIHEQHLWIALDREAEIRKGHDEYEREERPANAPMQLAVLESWGSRSWSLSWADGKKARLESLLTEIVPELFVEAEARYRSSCEADHRWRVEARDQRIEAIREERERLVRAEQERLEQLRLARIDRLLSEADAFRKAQTIRTYVTDAMENAAESVTLEELGEWARWALEIADSLDPVRNGSFLEQYDGAPEINRSQDARSTGQCRQRSTEPL